MKMKTEKYGCSSHNNMKAFENFWINLWTLIKWKMNILQIIRFLHWK